MEGLLYTNTLCGPVSIIVAKVLRQHTTSTLGKYFKMCSLFGESRSILSNGAFSGKCKLQ